MAKNNKLGPQASKFTGKIKTEAPSREDAQNKEHQKLIGRLSVAQEFEKSDRDMWKKVIKAVELMRDVADGDGNSVSRQIKYPLVWGAYDNYQSVLSSAPPQTVIVSEDRNDHVKTLYWRGVLDYVKRKVVKLDDLKYEFIQSFITTGKAVYKVGRKTEIQKVVDEKKVTLETGSKTLKNEREVVTKNESFVVNVDPRRIWVSPETRYQGPILGDECPYVIEEMVKTPDYLEARYDIKISSKEREKISIHDDIDEKASKQSKDYTKQTDDFDRVRLYAYYGDWQIDVMDEKGKPSLDKDGNVKIKMEKNVEVLFTNSQIVKKRQITYAHKKKPYIYLLNHRRFFQARGIGVLDAVLDLDQEYNEHMNRIRTYIRRMVNPKWAKKTGTKVDEAALFNPESGMMVEESEPNAFRPLSPPAIQGEIFQKATATEELFQFLTGITYGQTALKQVGTATGQQLAAEGSDVKISRMVRLLERAQEELETMLLQLEQQFSSEEATNIRVIGPDVIRLIKEKKKIFEIENQRFQMQQSEIQQGTLKPTPDGTMLVRQPTPVAPPTDSALTPDAAANPQMTPPMGQPTIEKMIEPPADEYNNFEISDDGRSVHTKYTREGIKGEFELYIVSQSSNRNNRAVRSKQYLDALDKSVNDPSINRPELWRNWFNINGETETDRLINSDQPPQMQQPAPGGGTGGSNLSAPTNGQANGAVTAGASRVV